MNKHTPGPWSFAMPREDGNYVKIYLHGLGRPDKIKGEDSLAGYCGEANGRLIAAAPDLLEALDDLLAQVEKDAPEWLSLNQARSAIAKAKGETNERA